MPFNLVAGPKAIKITHKLAAEWAAKEGCPGDRQLKQWRVDHLLAEIGDETMRPPEWATVYCRETEKEYRVNGKHSSTALASLNGTLPKNIHAIISHYECDTLQDVAELYATFDAREGARSITDVTRSFAEGSPVLSQLPYDVVYKAAPAIAYATWGDEQHRKDAAERAVLMLNNEEFVVWLHKLVGSGKSKDMRHIMRKSVVAAMYKTWQKNRGKATEFWTAVRDGSGHPHTTPDRRLRDYLMSAGVGVGRPIVRKEYREDGKSHRSVSGREMHAKCLHAWNAWRKGESTDLKYFQKAPLPVAV